MNHRIVLLYRWMIKRKIAFIFLLSSCFWLLLPAVFAEAEAIHPVRKLCEQYMEVPEEKFFTPYEVCIYALDDLDHERNYNDVRNFLLWYFKRINQADFSGMSGTTYDFTLRGNEDVTIVQYDSIDGYSGLFLYLLNEYEKKTGDAALLRENWNIICEIAYTIPYLQQPDGLTIAYPGYRMQYLMDNCEAYGGIMAFIEMGSRLNCSFDRPYYEACAQGIRSGIFTRLYDGKTNAFFWVNDEPQKNKGLNINQFYPDAYAQIFLAYFGIVSNKQANEIFCAFCENYPENNWLDMPLEQRTYCMLTKKKLEKGSIN